jgi:predicted ribosome quality control (RQC) complex YloA/Tae2 family protein
VSLNWKEINLVIQELDLQGAQIQKITQSNFHTLNLAVYGRSGAQNLLIVIRPGVCRIHLTQRTVPKSEKPLRFAELLRSRLGNARIEEITQIGSDRVIRLIMRRGTERFFLLVRLWSNAANILLTAENGVIIDAMRRLPKRGEISGEVYRGIGGWDSAAGAASQPEAPASSRVEKMAAPALHIRELPGSGSFNERLDDWYAEHGTALSLEALRAEALKNFEGSTARLDAALERLKAKEKAYSEADRLKQYGELILAYISMIKPGDEWLETADFFTANETIRIKLDPAKKAQENAAAYFDQYRKAKHGLERVQEEIAACISEIDRQKSLLTALLAETNPLRLQKRLMSKEARPVRRDGKIRPGLSFKRGDWLIIVGRSAAENDELLRRHVKGNDLWLHTRDFPGSYVFVKTRAGKTVPLNILLDAGNLALFYSKGRNAGKGDLFYTQVKYLRRAKNCPRGRVIPTQEKNLAIELDEKRLRDLEGCRT